MNTYEVTKNDGQKTTILAEYIRIERNTAVFYALEDLTENVVASFYTPVSIIRRRHDRTRDAA